MLKAGLAEQGGLWMAAGTGSSSSSSSQFDLFFCMMRDASRCIVYSSRCAPGEVTKELKHLGDYHGDYSSDYDVLAAIPLARATSLALARVSRIHARLTHSSLPSRARRLLVSLSLPPPSRPPPLHHVGGWRAEENFYGF